MNTFPEPFFSAAQRFDMIAEACQAVKSPLVDSWVQEQCHRLKHEGPEPVLLELQSLSTGSAIAEHIGYLQKRVAHMQYPAYRAAGWPIGSGSVESANKVVMQARLKGAGMRWAGTHVNALLALRTAVCNERWDEAWLRNERSARRRQLAHARLTALINSLLTLSMRLRLPRLPKRVLLSCLLRPCLVPLVRHPITFGNERLLAALSSLQKNDAHPLFKRISHQLRGLYPLTISEANLIFRAILTEGETGKMYDGSHPTD